MVMLRLLAAPLLATAALASAAPVSAPSGEWIIGPVIAGRNYSIGMPLHPQPTRRGWAFEFPTQGEGHVHYVTLDTGPLPPGARITLRYRIETAPGARFVAQATPDQPATVSLYLQRAGDSWKARTHEFHRWYAPTGSVRTLAPGVGTISISLADPAWTSVNGRPVAVNPGAFAAALADAERIGIVFGSAGARGHGVYATAPARFELLDFRID